MLQKIIHHQTISWKQSINIALDVDSLTAKILFVTYSNPIFGARAPLWTVMQLPCS